MLVADAQDSWSMFLAANRMQAPRPVRVERRERMLVFARDPLIRRWIEHEVFGEGVASEHAESLVDVISTLTIAAPPWPRYLVIDVAEISSSDAHLLAVIRAVGWPGVVIALGDAPKPMRKLLGIDITLPRAVKIGSEALRDALALAR